MVCLNRGRESGALMAWSSVSECRNALVVETRYAVEKVLRGCTASDAADADTHLSDLVLFCDTHASNLQGHDLSVLAQHLQGTGPDFSDSFYSVVTAMAFPENLNTGRALTLLCFGRAVVRECTEARECYNMTAVRDIITWTLVQNKRWFLSIGGMRGLAEACTLPRAIDRMWTWCVWSVLLGTTLLMIGLIIKNT